MIKITSGKTFLGRALLLPLGFLAFAFSARAAETPQITAEHLRAHLFAASQEGDVIYGGLEIDLDPGWHTYWRNPGDSGLAPVLDWVGSQNVAGVKVHWPVPERFEDFGLYTFGYTESVMLPLEIRKEDEGPAVINLDATFMICQMICIPQKAVFQFALPAALEHDPALVKKHKEVTEKLPVAGELPGLKIETVVAGPEAFVVTVFAQHGVDELDLFVEAENIALNQPPEISFVTGDVRRAVLRIPAPPDVENLTDALVGKVVQLTLLNRGRAIEKQIEF